MSKRRPRRKWNSKPNVSYIEPWAIPPEEGNPYIPWSSNSEIRKPNDIFTRYNKPKRPPRRKRYSKPNVSNIEPWAIPPEQGNLYVPWSSNSELRKQYEPSLPEHQILQESYQFQQEPRSQWPPSLDSSQHELPSEIWQSNSFLNKNPPMMPQVMYQNSDQANDIDAREIDRFPIRGRMTGSFHSGKSGPLYTTIEKQSCYRNTTVNVNKDASSSEFDRSAIRGRMTGSFRSGKSNPLHPNNKQPSHRNTTVNVNNENSAGDSWNNSLTLNGNYGHSAHRSSNTSTSTFTGNWENTPSCSWNNSPSANVYNDNEPIIYPSQKYERSAGNSSAIPELENSLKKANCVRTVGFNQTGKIQVHVSRPIGERKEEEVEYLYSMHSKKSKLIQFIDLSEDGKTSEEKFSKNLVPEIKFEKKLCYNPTITHCGEETDSVNKGYERRKKSARSNKSCTKCNKNYEILQNRGNLYSSKCGHLFCGLCLENLKSSKCEKCGKTIISFSKVVL